MNFTQSLFSIARISGFTGLTWGSVIMMLVGGILLYLAIVKKYEPLLLLPIAFGAILVNLPFTGLMEEGIFKYIVIWYSARTFSHTNIHGYWCNDRFRSFIS